MHSTLIEFHSFDWNIQLCQYVAAVVCGSGVVVVVVVIVGGVIVLVDFVKWNMASFKV